jgi:hypothetical protein
VNKNSLENNIRTNDERCGMWKVECYSNIIEANRYQDLKSLDDGPVKSFSW